MTTPATPAASLESVAKQLADALHRLMVKAAPVNVYRQIGRDDGGPRPTNLDGMTDLDVIAAHEAIAAYDAAQLAPVERKAEPVAYSYCGCCKGRFPCPMKWIQGFQLCDTCYSHWWPQVQTSVYGFDLSIACHANPRLYDAAPPASSDAVADEDKHAVVVTDEELRALWRKHGGDFHGPNVETGTMPESKLLPFLRSIVDYSAALESFAKSIAERSGSVTKGE